MASSAKPVKELSSAQEQAVDRSGTASNPNPLASRNSTLLEVDNLRKSFVQQRRWLRPNRMLTAVNDLSFSLECGRTLAIVGESGSGKSTLAKLLAGSEKPDSGSISLWGQDVLNSEKPLVNDRYQDSPYSQDRYSQIRMIFQDPYASLNPRATVGSVLEEPLINRSTLDASARLRRIEEALSRVGLRPEHAGRYPHMFSGGQRQRIAIARALILDPVLLVADEPLSALDVSVQAQIINLLLDLQEELAISFIFISHDLGVVQHFSDTVLVMYLGQLMEYGTVAQIFDNPQHPYTKALLLSNHAYRKQKNIGDTNAPIEAATTPLPEFGCPFAPRCPQAEDVCRQAPPPEHDIDGQRIACHFI